MRDFVVKVVTTKDQEEINYKIELDSDSPNLYLYAQSCTEVSKCGFLTNSVVINKDNFRNHGLKFQEGVNSKKRLDYKITCGKGNAYESKQITDTYTEFTCYLNVGVYAKQTGDKGSPFTLMIHDMNQHMMVPTLHWKRFNVEESIPILLQFNLHRKRFDAINHLLFSILLEFGKVELLISKTNRNPCDGKDVFTLTADSAGRKNLAIYRKQLQDKKFKGAFYGCLKASELSLVKVLFNPIVLKFKEGSNDPTKGLVATLPAGEQIFSIIKQSQIRYFRFVARVNKDSGEQLQIHLTSVRGVFRIMVSNNNKLPVASQTYWNTVGNTLIIKSTDPGFTEDGYYIVGVEAPASRNPDSAAPNKTYSFFISYSHSSRHNLLRSGMPWSGLTTKENLQHHFEIDIPKTVSNMTLLKSCFHGTLSAYISFNTSTSYPDASNKDFEISSNRNGIFLSGEDIKKHCLDASICKIFISIHSPIPVHYTLSYVTGTDPFTLAQGHPSTLPMLLSVNHPLYFVHYLDKGKLADFEISSNYQQLQYLVKGHDPQNGGRVFPKSSDGNTSMIERGSTVNKTAFSMSPDQTMSYKELLITVLPEYSPPDHGGDYAAYNFLPNGIVEITSGDKLLPSGRAVKGHVSNGEWKYYRIHHPTNSAHVVVTVELHKGIAEVFISKGLHMLPSETNYIVRRLDGREESLTIDRNNIGQMESLIGDYMVGIKGSSNQGAEFTVVYQASDLQTLILPLGKPVTYTIRSTSTTYIEIPSDWYRSDIVLTYRARTAHLNLFAIARANIEDRDVNPTPEHFTWSSKLDNYGGIGRLVIDSSNPSFCTMCSYKILVETSTQDRVEFMATKRTPNQLIHAYEGKQNIGSLRKDENDTYIINLPYNESLYNIELKVLKGNITLIYTVDYSFTNPHLQYVIKEKTKDEFFTLNIGAFRQMLNKLYHHNLTRYIRIHAEEDSDYIFSIVSNEMLTEIHPLESKSSILGPGLVHYYYFPSVVNETPDISFHLRNVVEEGTVDFSDYISKLQYLVKVFHVSDFKEVQSRKFNNEIRVDSEIYMRELRLHFRVFTGYTVIEVVNKFAKPIAYTLDLSRYNTKLLETRHETPDFIDLYKVKYYILDRQPPGTTAFVKFQQCLGDITAQYRYVDTAFEDQNSTTGGSSNHSSNSGFSIKQGYKVMFNQEFDNGYIKMQEGKQVSIKVEKEYSNMSRHIHGGDYNRRYNPDIPSVYLMQVEMRENLGGDTGVDPTAFVAGDVNNHGEVEIFTDSDQAIKFKGLSLHKDFLEQHEQFKVFINYTLYMSKDKEMMKFMKKCSTYKIDVAEKAFNTKNHYSYSTSEYYDLKIAEKRELVPTLMISPHSLSFGGVYYGVVVAELRFWKATSSNSFPASYTMRVYYNEFEFEPQDFSTALVFILSFLAIGIIVLLLYLLAKNKMLDNLKSIKAVRTILGEFDEEHVGNHLVLEILDHKKQKKRRMDESSNASLVADDSVAESESSARELTETINDDSVQA